MVQLKKEYSFVMPKKKMSSVPRPEPPGRRQGQRSPSFDKLFDSTEAKEQPLLNISKDFKVIENKAPTTDRVAEEKEEEFFLPSISQSSI